ncbi:YbbR-like domain-containing protein [Mariniphaga sp.]|uniref:CdaR family protein n=1 Tax=Mariniphaga sp. TaxID=1954475 RepID=UPI003569C677
MNKKISEFFGYFKLEKLRNDKRIVVFSVCLLIAASLWFLNVMGKDYTTVLSYSVKYVNPPKNLFLANTPPSKLELNVQAHGFTLLRHKLAFSFSPIVLDLSAISQSLESDNNEYRVPSENLIRRIETQVSKEITINGVSPQTFSLVFDSLNTKKVPVSPLVELNFKPQFNLKGIVESKPDSVKITGPAAVLDTLTILHTEKVTFEGLDKSIEQFVNVAHPGNTEISPEKVEVIVPVEKFTEKKISLPIQVINLPEDVNLKLFPPNIAVTVMVGLSEYEKVSTRDFTATVDFTQALSGENYLEVSVETNKDYIQLMKIVPNSIEYLIESE